MLSKRTTRMISTCRKEPRIRTAAADGEADLFGAVRAKPDIGGGGLVSPHTGVNVATLELNPKPRSRSRRRSIV